MRKLSAILFAATIIGCAPDKGPSETSQNKITEKPFDGHELWISQYGESVSLLAVKYEIPQEIALAVAWEYFKRQDLVWVILGNPPSTPDPFDPQNGLSAGTTIRKLSSDFKIEEKRLAAFIFETKLSENK